MKRRLKKTTNGVIQQPQITRSGFSTIFNPEWVLVFFNNIMGIVRININAENYRRKN